MDNAKAAILIIIILLCDFNFLLFVNANNQGKQKMPNTNLAPIDDTLWWRDSGEPGAAPIGNIYLEETVTHNGALTWKIVPDAANKAVDHDRITIEPGQRIYVSVWIKTGGSTPASYSGARIGLDFYDDVQRIMGANCELDAASGYLNEGTPQDEGFVHWGNDWVQVVWDFTVPSYCVADGFLGYSEGTPVVPTCVIPWCQIYSASYPSDAYTSYFSDFTFYINPVFVNGAVLNAALNLLRR